MNDLLALFPLGDARRGLQLFVRALHHSLHRFTLLSLLAIAGSSTLFSQQFATLNLTVTDPAGKVIAGAKVSVRNVDTGVIRAGVSDKLGLVAISGLPAGEYKFTAGAEGFGAYEAPLTLTLGRRPLCKLLSESAQLQSKWKYTTRLRVSTRKERRGARLSLQNK